MKCTRGCDLLFFCLFLVAKISHVSLIASSVIFHCDFRLTNPVLRVNDFFIAMRSWPR
jgi:hypothetical protein